MCRRIISALFFLTVSILPSLSHATPINLLGLLRHHSGYSVTEHLSQGTLSYSAETQKLLYVHSGTFRFDSREGWVGDFPSMFTWQLSVSDDGSVLQPGTMTWLGDVGAGTEVLATGIVRRLGFEQMRCVEEPGPFDLEQDPHCSWGTPHVIIRNTFLHPVLRDLGRHMMYIVSMNRPYAPNPPFSENFSCGRNGGPDCIDYSDSGLAGLNLPEPNMTLLLGLGLIVLGFVRVGTRAKPPTA